MSEARLADSTRASRLRSLRREAAMYALLAGQLKRWEEAKDNGEGIYLPFLVLLMASQRAFWLCNLY
jgi:hypothetical protein